MVLESGIPTYLNLFLERLLKQLHIYDRELIVVIPPIREDAQVNLNEEAFRKLTNVVDYLSLMTYDYSSHKLWVIRSKRFVWFQNGNSCYTIFHIRITNWLVTLNALLPHVPSSHLPTSTGGANAPIDWMEDNILDLTSDDNRHKLLLGLNMYGMDYSDRAPPEAVTGPRLLEILRRFSLGTTLTWDKESEEHFLEYTDEQGGTHKLWTPTLKVKKKGDLW